MKRNTAQASDRKCTYGRDLRPQPPQDNELPQVASCESTLMQLQIYCQPTKTAPSPEPHMCDARGNGPRVNPDPVRSGGRADGIDDVLAPVENP